MPWSTPFDEPIPLPRGRKLRTLQEAADHILALAQAQRAHPQTPDHPGTP